MNIIEQQLETIAESTKTLLVSGARNDSEAETIRRRVDYTKYKIEEAKAAMECNFGKAAVLHTVADIIQRGQ